MVFNIWFEISVKCGSFMLVRRRSVSAPIAFELCNASKVVESIERFLMNLSIVIWWFGDIRFSSLSTPEAMLVCHSRMLMKTLRCKTVRSATISLTWFSAWENRKKIFAIRPS